MHAFLCPFHSFLQLLRLSLAVVRAAELKGFRNRSHAFRPRASDKGKDFGRVQREIASPSAFPLQSQFSNVYLLPFYLPPVIFRKFENETSYSIAFFLYEINFDNYNRYDRHADSLSAIIRAELQIRKAMHTSCNLITCVMLNNNRAESRVPIAGYNLNLIFLLVSSPFPFVPPFCTASSVT